MIGMIKRVPGLALRAGGRGIFHTLKGMGSFWNVRGYKQAGRQLLGSGKALLGGDFTSENLLKMGKNSANLLGKGSMLVMGTRAVMGRNPVKDKAGKVNIPFVPFV